VTDESAAQAAVQTAVTTFGRLDVVVNNAGYGDIAPFEQLSTERFKAVMDNFYGVVNVARAAVPLMREQRSGCVLQITAVKMSAGDGLICAINKVAATARLALSAVPAKKPDTDALADVPTRHALAEGVNSSDHLVARHTWEGNTRQEAIDRCRIRMANATSLHFYANFTGRWIDKRTIYEFEFSGARYLNCAVRRHIIFLFSMFLPLDLKITRQCNQLLNDVV
jgi:hypothetical protein